MKILTTKNGIALIAVLALLLVLTLFLPTMFTMSEISMEQAVVGTDAQRASYLARSVTEMSVASFKKSYDLIQEKKDKGILGADTQLEKVSDAYDDMMKNNTSIETSTVEMFFNKEDNSFVYATTSTDASKYSDTSKYEKLGSSTCTITYDNSTDYYKVNSTTQEATKINKTDYDNGLKDFNNALGGSASTLQYSYSYVENKNVVFSTVATVKGQTRRRSCIVVLPTYPGEQEWLVFDGTVDPTNHYIVTDGCNQAQANPKKASGKMLVNYADANIKDYKAQPMQIYSCLGNMIINTRKLKDRNGTEVLCGKDFSEIILGVQPRLNTEPDDDPTFKRLQGIYTATYSDETQKDNFITFTSTNAIQVDLPVNILVNPARSVKGLADMNLLASNKSIYKIMMFQAPTIYFSRSVDMMVSLFRPTKNSDARRISTVILMAPPNSPYTYYNEDRKAAVKAGMVYFAEDCYLWVINPGDSGSAYRDNSSLAGFFQGHMNVYNRDTDFTKLKIANAGDVFYFNNEVARPKTTASNSIIGRIIGRKNHTGEYQYAGVSLTEYAFDTDYRVNYKEYTSSDEWWEIFKNTRQALFGFYLDRIPSLQNDNPIYVKDDLHLIGNVYSDPNLDFPEIEDFYTVWSN